MSDREFIGISLEELRGSFKAPGLTEGERDALLDRYRGKWLKDTVKVQHILYWPPEGICVACGPNLGFLLVFFRPGDTSWYELAAPLNQGGRSVGVIGQIWDVQVTGAVRLLNGELFEPTIDSGPLVARE